MAEKDHIWNKCAVYIATQTGLKYYIRQYKSVMSHFANVFRTQIFMHFAATHTDVWKRSSVVYNLFFDIGAIKVRLMKNIKDYSCLAASTQEHLQN